MNRFQANDLRNLVTEVVSAYKAEKRNKWLLESPEVIEEGVFDPGILKAVFTGWRTRKRKILHSRFDFSE